MKNRKKTRESFERLKAVEWREMFKKTEFSIFAEIVLSPSRRPLNRDLKISQRKYRASLPLSQPQN